jgi:hypothetical protein
MKNNPSSPNKLSKILTFDGQVIATGLLDAEGWEGQFQATETIPRESVESLTEVLAEVNGQRIHLIEWHRCEAPFAHHFHFRRKL